MVKFIEAGLFRDVGEHDRSVVYEATSRDRARLGIFDCGMRGTSRDSSSASRRRFLLDGFLTVGCDSDQQNRKQDREVTGRR